MQDAVTKQTAQHKRNSAMVKLTIASISYITGVVIYLLFRERHLLGFKVADSLGMGDTIDMLRECVKDIHPHNFVLFCLPDGLWTIAYILLIEHVFRTSSTSIRLAWAAVIPFLGIASELLQMAGLCKGVYDTRDLLCYAVPLAIDVVINLQRTTK